MQLQHCYSIGFDVALLIRWLFLNLTSTAKVNKHCINHLFCEFHFLIFNQRFESVVSLTRERSNSGRTPDVWWDTRMGAGSGDSGCLGLRLGQGGQIKDLDVSYEAKVYSKV